MKKGKAIVLGLACFGLLASPAMAVRGESSSKGPIFGFTGPEAYPIDLMVSELHQADLDGDGLTDLIVVNNARSKINLLYNQTGKTNSSPDSAATSLEINELPPDARFRIESIASEKRIAALAATDLDGDGRPDLAYYGDKELVVIYNRGSNTWSTPKTWPIDDGQITPNALAVGDINGDRRSDLLLLGENCVYILRQTPDHTLAEPERIPFSGAVKSAQILDVDGDGRQDLLLVNWENANPFRFRLQNQQGQLGPELYFSLPAIRSYTADDLDGDGKTEIITIALNSGRVQISNFSRKPADPLSGSFRQGQFQVLPLTKTTKPKRGVAWADIDGDQRPDLLVAEPESGQLTFFLQQADGSFGPAKSFPTLSGVSELAVAPAASKQASEIFLMSPDERQVGVTRLDPQGRLAFPTILPVTGKPLAMTAGARLAGKPPTLALILDQDGKRVLCLREADGQVTTRKFKDDFKANPAAMAFHDANQDGHPDLVILSPYEKIKVLLQKNDGQFDEIDVLPPGGAIEQPWMSMADVDGDGKPELLLAQKNFLRAVVLKPDVEARQADEKGWSLVVKDQVNGAAGNSRIVGAAPLTQASNTIPALFLLDAERKALTLCQRDTNGVWQVARNIALPFAEFDGIKPLALGAKSFNSIGLLGLNAVGWLTLTGQVWQMTELDSYETRITDGHLHDVIPGDLNGDGRKDLVFLETAKNYVDIVHFSREGKLVPATRWQVFEQRSYMRRQSDMPEPREALIVDVTGDKKNDLVLLVHDRILVYPQE